jgi:HEAT repeat protein
MALVANPHPDVRLATLEISQHLPLERAEEVVMELILDDDTEVRGMAIQEIGVRHFDDWQDILRDSLSDSDETIVVAAVNALFRAGTADSVKILEDFTRKTDNVPLRRAIEGQLENLRRATHRETL